VSEKCSAPAPTAGNFCGLEIGHEGWHKASVWGTGLICWNDPKRTPSAPQAAKPEPPMPADLKKVAREIAYKCTEVVESRLQTLVAEVRAQAMEEAAKICDHETAYQSQYAHGIAREPMRAMGHVISEVIRRRASGNSGKD
jgi:hypothetical protein